MQWLATLESIDWKAFAVAWSLKVLAALVILVIGLRLAKWTANVAERGLVRANVEATAVQFLRKVAYVALLVLLALTVLGVFDVPMTSAFAVLGAAGLAIGLALKDSLSNIASGVMLVTLKPFRVGDTVTIKGQTGRVEIISIFQTTLRGADNQTIVLPNSLVTNDSIINLTPGQTRRIELVVGIAYNADIDGARATALEVMHADPRVLADPPPDVLVYALADNSVNLGVRCHAMNADWFALKCDLTERLKKAFDATGVAIPFPQRDVHVYHHARDGRLVDPPQTAVPEAPAGPAPGR